MKNSIKIMILILALISSAMIVQADDQSKLEAGLRLPNGYVTMNAEYGPDSWFDMILSDVPDGFDVTDGKYTGWCIQKSIFMTQDVNHTVLLYSSYDPNMPDCFKNDNWDKLNYIINNKNGSRQSIQDVIWYYIESDPLPTDPDAQKMINDSDLYGDGFVPQPGQIVAILVEGINDIQRTFFEFMLDEPVHLGNLVWNDLNKNGLQEKGEPGFPNVKVNLYFENDTFVKSSKTDIKGHYSFYGLESGNYYLEFELIDGYSFSVNNVGVDDNLDSDADIYSGKTEVFYVNSSKNDPSWDAGIYEKSESDKDKKGKNHKPTADGTAGEPYTGIEKQGLEFNGSKSYDRDGYIVNYTWKFGDDTKDYGEVVNHTFDVPGAYKVVLLVIDNQGAIDTYETLANIKFENRAPGEPTIDGPVKGHKNIYYKYEAVSNDPDDDQVKYTFSWGDSKYSDTDSLFMACDTPFAAGIIWSEPGKYNVSVTVTDGKLTSNSELVVYIDWVDVTDIGYLIDDNSDGIFDTYHHLTGDITSKAKHIGENKYLIDIDGDGIWDYEFDSETGELIDYSNISDYNYILILIAIIAVLLLVIIFYIGKKKNNK